MADKLVAVDDSTGLLPPLVRNAYLSDIQNRLNTAVSDSVANMPNVAQAVSDKLAPLTTDSAVSTVLNNASSATVTKLDARYNVYDAPAPSGGDDTAALLSLVNLAATTKGEVLLKHGTYRCNLDIVSGFQQPTIRGRGRHQTRLQAYDTSKPIVKFNGGSGSIAGGGLRSLNLDGTDHSIPTTVGVAFSGCGGVTCEDIEINSCAVAVLWWNERGNDFSEFDTFEGSIYNCRSPFVYRMDNGVESFHGSGPIGNTVVGMPSDSTSAIISTIGNALPYNAPLFMHVFFSNSSQYIINYVNTVAGRHASFFGRINIEGKGNDTLGGGNQRVLYNGSITHFGSKDTVLGNIFLCSKISYEGGYVGGDLLPVTQRILLNSAPTQIFNGILSGGQTGLVAAHIRQGNYDYAVTLLCYQGIYDGGGSTTVLATHVSIDNNNPKTGAPQFTWNNGLYISNPNYSNAFTVFAKMTILGGDPQSANLAQLK